MERVNLYYLSYFLNGYWHQLGDEIYGTLENATSAFSSAETTEFGSGLLRDLKQSKELGLLADDYFDPVYESKYWSQFQRVIVIKDADVMERVLLRQSRRHDTQL